MQDSERARACDGGTRMGVQEEIEMKNVPNTASANCYKQVCTAAKIDQLRRIYS